MTIMRILVCNDDGIESPGLRLLADAASALPGEVWTVAPARKWTAASHQLTFDAELTLTRHGERAYVCSGAPADCVVAAMTALFAGSPRPDLVLAGINDKRNVGEDVAYSGTTAIAREATFWGVPAIALSRTGRWTDEPAELAALRRLLAALWHDRAEWAAEGHWLSVNLPAALPAPIVQARIGRDKIAGSVEILERSPAAIRYRLVRARPGGARPGDENAVLAAGHIAIVRHRWQAESPLPEALIERWNDVEGDDAPVA